MSTVAQNLIEKVAAAAGDKTNEDGRTEISADDIKNALNDSGVKEFMEKARTESKEAQEIAEVVAESKNEKEEEAVSI